MTFSTVKAALCFKLCDDFGKKFSWNSFVNGVSKTDTLEDAIRKQDDIVTIKNTTIVPYLEAEGTRITQVVLFPSVGGMFQLGAKEALANDMESLIQLNGSGSVVKVEIEIKVAGTLECLQQQDAFHESSSRSTNSMQYLMQSQKRAHDVRSRYERNRLPQPKADTNGKFRLWNTLLEFCIENGVQFFSYIDESERERTFSSIVSILWKLNLVEMKMNKWKKKPPKCMDRFLGFSLHDTSTDGGKRKRPSLYQDILNDIHKSLTAVLDSVCFTQESVKMFEFLTGLLESIDSQITDYVHRSQRKSTKKLEESWQAMWSKGNGNTMAGQEVKIKKLVSQ